ncbi:MAG: PD40 domain-containing protein [Anaerolineales bacterium]|nr:PD40 domain-containing protein [Anaerolineales bacterium]
MPKRRIFSRRNQARTPSVRLPIGLLLVAAAIALCVLVPSTPINISNLAIADKSLPTPLATFTPLPRPTKAHIGRIIFTCTRGDYNQLCMINADGTDYKQLTDLEAHNYYPVYSPLGGSVVYASNQNGGVFDLFLYIFEGARLIRLTNNIGNVISPSFSPDGSRILFANRAAEGPTSLWTIDRTGENADLLYAGPNTIVAADWSPVGDRIAFAMAVDQPDAYEVFVMDADGTNVRQLTRGLAGIGGSLDWSPDGKHLLIYAGPPGDKNIFLVDVAAETAAQLTNGGNNAACSFSPDGQWIAFNSLRNNDQADIFIMRSDGSDVRQVTDNPEPDWQPHWEP